MWTGLQMLETLNLVANSIATISPEGFSPLTQLRILYLSSNYLSEIHGDMWVGLQSLETLDLTSNNVGYIACHGLSHMPLLKTLDLSSNYLTTLKRDIFHPDGYPNSHGHPSQLELGMGDFQLQCDASFCWLKEAVEAGSILLTGSPICNNLAGIPFEAVNLNCNGCKYNLLPCM